jgi:hypothetical protein
MGGYSSVPASSGAVGRTPGGAGERRRKRHILTRGHSQRAGVDPAGAR